MHAWSLQLSSKKYQLVAVTVEGLWWPNPIPVMQCPKCPTITVTGFVSARNPLLPVASVAMRLSIVVSPYIYIPPPAVTRIAHNRRY